jgi:hypothetical protein
VLISDVAAGLLVAVPVPACEDDDEGDTDPVLLEKLLSPGMPDLIRLSPSVVNDPMVVVL